MNVLVILIPVSLVLGCIGLIAFLWTVQSDQYDDANGNAARILINEDELIPDGSQSPYVPKIEKGKNHV